MGASQNGGMIDLDAVQAQIARNMLESGDWVTARLDGVMYLEKSPLIYWMIAATFAVPDAFTFCVEALQYRGSSCW